LASGSERCSQSKSIAVIIYYPAQELLIPLTKATILFANNVAASIVYGVSIVSLQPPTEIPKAYFFYAHWAAIGLNLSDAHQPPFGLLIGQSRPSAEQKPVYCQVLQNDPSNYYPLYIMHLSCAK